jgi:hypothetical protein
VIVAWWLVERGNGRALLLRALVAFGVVAAKDDLAFAETGPGVRFVYSDRSNANCPDESSLRSAARQRLGFDPFTPSARSTVYATITRTARGLRGEIRLDSPGRESAAHSIESVSSDCAELGKAMALAISIAVDATRALSATQSSSSDQETSPAGKGNATSASGATAAPHGKPAAGSGAEDEHLTPPAMEPELQGDGSIASDANRHNGANTATPVEDSHWQVALDGLTSVGFTPGVSAGSALGAGWVGQNSSFEVAARADLPQSQNHAAGSIRVWPLLFTAAPCVNVRGWAFCGLGRIGTLHGSGQGFPVNMSGSSLIATVGARLANEAILSKPVRFRVFFDLDWLATNNSFDVDHRPAWATSTWAVSLGLGLTMRFP